MTTYALWAKGGKSGKSCQPMQLTENIPKLKGWQKIFLKYQNSVCIIHQFDKIEGKY